MRTTPIALMVLCAASAAHAAELDVQSRIDTVTVYPDGATVTRLIRVELPRGDNVLRATDFPPGLDPSSLRVEGEGSGAIVIGSVDARAPRAERPPVPPAIERQVEVLKDERASLDDRIAAATARKKFVERFADKSPAGLGEKGEARPITEWKTAFATVAEEITAADALIREARLRQREIDRELVRLDAEIKKDPPRKFEVRIDLAAEAATPATLRVSYTVRGARWVPLYDARLDTGTKSKAASLELVRRAEIVQQTGEDWGDVALSVSTVRTAKGGNAPELRPLVVRLLQPSPRIAYSGVSQDRADELRMAARDREPASAPAMQPVAKAREIEAEVDTGGYQAVFRIPGRISVAANEGAKSFRIVTATIAPALLVRAAPALDQTAFLEASFKQAEDAPLLPGRVAIYRDGIYVGRGQMALTPKDETVRLGFGADDKVKVARIVMRKTAGSAGIILSSKTDERDFKITVRNGHDAPVRVVVEDQLPISETEDVLVEMLSGSTPPTERDVRDRRGVMAWTFDAAPGEAREIKFGWRLRWPADRSVVYTPGQT
jgi:uncharacterized protein (TIGR02231 family)